MCGIAGISMIEGREVDTTWVDALAEALEHRGPDGEGRHTRAGTALMQKRLAIIDLSGGDQPLYGPDGENGPVLVANGEIYNYRELRASMTDVAFSTGSDCETPLHLYRQYGVKFVRHPRGMYAIAIDDPVNDQLVLARDPFGIKPLYYAEGESGLVFASEIQAIVGTGLVSTMA